MEVATQPVQALGLLKQIFVQFLLGHKLLYEHPCPHVVGNSGPTTVETQPSSQFGGGGSIGATLYCSLYCDKSTCASKSYHAAFALAVLS